MIGEVFFVIEYRPGLWVMHSPLPRSDYTVDEALDRGWRPISWTRDLERAEKFASYEAAEMFRRASCNPGWEVKSIVPVFFPFAPLGAA